MKMVHRGARYLRGKLGPPRKDDVRATIVELKEKSSQKLTNKEIASHLRARGFEATPESVRKMYDRAADKMRT